SLCCFFFQAEDGIRAFHVTGVQTCALPISWLESLCREAHLEGRKCSGCTCRPARRRAGRVAAFHARAGGPPRRAPIMGALFPGGSPMAVILTPAALERVQRFLQRDPQALGLRFGVERTGCSGWGHVADLARDQREGDTVFEQDGVRIYVDATSLPLVDGTEIDFARQGLGEGFIFRNPNAKAECGCGESFT